MSNQSSSHLGGGTASFCAPPATHQAMTPQAIAPENGQSNGAILDALPLARLRFDLQTTESADTQPYKGDMLRTALLWWLGEYWCQMPQRCRNGCQGNGACWFGRLCEPPVDPSWPSKVRRLMGGNAPPAYALWDLQDRRRRLPQGAAWRFELTLIGQLALQQVPAIVAAVQEGAERGMGRVRLRSRVRRVDAVGEVTHTLAEEKPHGAEMILTWQSYDLERFTFDYRRAQEWAASFGGPVHGLSLRFLSPVKIKERGEWVKAPRFSAIMRAVVRRLRLLSVAHGAGEWPHAQWGYLLDLAETVRLEHDESTWAMYRRWSKRAGAQQMEGFVGQAWYASDADLAPLLPALWLGQWLHIGKAYVLGNGRYSIEALHQ